MCSAHRFYRLLENIGLEKTETRADDCKLSFCLDGRKLLYFEY
jgi:hypothetical protein